MQMDSSDGGADIIETLVVCGWIDRQTILALHRAALSRDTRVNQCPTRNEVEAPADVAPFRLELHTKTTTENLA